MFRAAWATLLYLLPLLLAPQLVLAQATREPAASDEAGGPREETLRAALSAYERGDLSLARTLFEAVHAEDPSARTLRGLGIVAYRQGRYVDAVALLEQSLQSPARPLTAEMQTSVQVLLRDASLRVSRLSLVVLPASAAVRVDGQAGVRSLSGELLLSPGSHTLEASAEGHATSKLVVDTREGESQRLELELPRLPEASAPAPLPTVREVTAKTSEPVVPKAVATREAPARSRRLKRTAYALMGVAGAGLVAGAVGTRLGMQRIGDIEELCRDQDSGKCTLSQVRAQEDKHNTKLMSVLSIGGFALAGVSAATAGSLFWVVYRPRSELSARASELSVGLRAAF